MQKQRWAKSSNGPDVTDVEMMMRAIGALHSGGVGIQLSPLGIGSTGGIRVSCTMTFDVLPGSSLPEVVVAESTWPCSEGHDIWAHIFSGLYTLDHEISKVYENGSLWK